MRLTLVPLCLFFVACGLTHRSAAPPVRPVVNIPALAGKTPPEVDAVLGVPAEVTLITNDPTQDPGEYRDYRIAGVKDGVTTHGLMVRFNDGQAVHFTLDLPDPQESAETALLRAGIDVRNSRPTVTALAAKSWAGIFGGVYFKDVAAVKADRGFSNYTTVQANLR